MLKSSRLLLALLFFTGILLGYYDLFHWRNPGNSSDKTAPNAESSRRPFSGQHPGTTSLPYPSENNLNNLLLKYTYLPLQETKNELIRLFEYNKTRDNDNSCNEAIKFLAFKLGNQSPEEAEKLLTDRKYSSSWELYPALLSGWAQQDVPSAMVYLLNHKEDSPYSSQAFELMAKIQTEKDPALTLQWLTTLTPGERATAIGPVAEEFPKYHPDKMADFLAALTDEERKSSTLNQNLISAWALVDWDSFQTWADTLEPQDKDDKYSMALWFLCQNDLEKATLEFKKYDKTRNYPLANAIIGSMSLSEESSEKTLDWIMEQKDNLANVPYLVSSAVAGLPTENRELTRKILQLPSGIIRDTAIESFLKARSMMSSSHKYDYNRSQPVVTYPEAMALARQIGNADVQNRLTDECLRSWINNSPDQASQWIMDQSPLSPEDKAKYLQIRNQKD